MSNFDLKSIGERIKKLREKTGLTQEGFAEKMLTTRQTVAKWETGRQDFKTQEIIRMADIFHVSCDYLLRGISTEYIDIYKTTGLTEQAVNNISKTIKLKIEKELPDSSTEYLPIIDTVNNFLSWECFTNMIILLAELELRSDWQLTCCGFSPKTQFSTCKALDIDYDTFQRVVKPRLTDFDEQQQSDFAKLSDNDCDLLRYRILNCTEGISNLFDLRDITECISEKDRVLSLIGLSDKEFKELIDKKNDNNE